MRPKDRAEGAMYVLLLYVLLQY